MDGPLLRGPSSPALYASSAHAIHRTDPSTVSSSHSSVAFETIPRCSTVATLISFVAAFVHFVTELLIFETISLRRAYIPLAISGHINVLSFSLDHEDHL